MNKNHIAAIACGVAPKLFGFFVYYLLTIRNRDSDILPEILLYLAIVFFIQSTFFIPLTHNIVMRKSLEPSLRLRKLYIVFIVTFSVILLYKGIDYVVITWLVVMYLGIQVEARMICANSIVYSLVSSLRNIIIVIYLIVSTDIDLVIHFAAVGEVIKIVIFCFLTRNVKLEGDLRINSTQTMQYIWYVMYVSIPGLLLLCNRFFLNTVSQDLLVDFEILLKLSEIVISGITAGLVPLYLSVFGGDDASKIRHISIIVYVIMVLFILPFLIVYSDIFHQYLGLIISKSEMTLCFVVLMLVLPLWINLVFLRKAAALVVQFKQLTISIIAMLVVLGITGCVVLGFELKNTILVVLIGVLCFAFFEYKYAKNILVNVSGVIKA